MKEENIIYNGQYLLIEENNTKIFLHADSSLTLIHLVEASENFFKRRVEFKKKINDTSKYLTFSYDLKDNIVFSGYLTISDTSEIAGTISYQIMRPNTTRIIDGYYITITSSTYYLEHIVTLNKQECYTGKEDISVITLSNIEAFLFNILNQINNNHSIRNKTLIPYPPSINKIMGEEKSIIDLIKSITDTYPELNTFLKEYQFSRKRIRTNWHSKIIWYYIYERR